jgi:RES domain-containing protein
VKAYRIADRRYPIFSGTGARLLGGRWNSPGVEVIYCAETFAGAILEVLVHAGLGRIPSNHACVEIEIPDELKVEVVSLAGSMDDERSRVFGDLWVKEQRTVVLLTPSVVTGARERNVILNPARVDFSRIQVSQPFAVKLRCQVIPASLITK